MKRQIQGANDWQCMHSPVLANKWNFQVNFVHFSDLRRPAKWPDWLLYPYVCPSGQKRASHRQLQQPPQFVLPTRERKHRKPYSLEYIAWNLEQPENTVDIFVLELQVSNGFTDRLASLEQFTGPCSIQVVPTTNQSRCPSEESVFPNLITTSLGVVIDWDAIEGATVDDIWEAFRVKLTDETLYRPVRVPFSAKFQSSAWHHGLKDNTIRISPRGQGSRYHHGRSSERSLMSSTFILLMISMFRR